MKLLITSTVFVRVLAEENVHVTASAGASTIVTDLAVTLPLLSPSEQEMPVNPKPSGSETVAV
jgi:hypothetical protein